MSNDDIMKHILDKLENIDEKVDNIDKTLATQAVELAEHTKRSTALEDEFKPIRASVLQIQGALKLLTVIGSLLAIIAGIKSLL